MAGEPAGGRLSQRFATSTLALVNNSNSGDLSSRRNSASSGISNISCGGGGGNSVFTSTPGVSTSEAVEVEGSAASASSPSSSPAGVGAVAGAADTIGRINEDGRTVGASSSSRPVVVPTSRDVKDWEVGTFLRFVRGFSLCRGRVGWNKGDESRGELTGEDGRRFHDLGCLLRELLS